MGKPEDVAKGVKVSAVRQYFKKWFDNKDKSLLIGQLCGTLLILILFITVLWGEEYKTLGLCLFVAGMTMGWVMGILLSPYQEYNNEATKFSKATQVISTFISGAVVAKLLSILTLDDIKYFFCDFELLTRTLYFQSAFILTAILVYYDRAYPNLDEQGSFITWCREIFPGQTLSIQTEALGSDFMLTIDNLGSTDLHFRRGDKYDSTMSHFTSTQNTFQTLHSSEIGASGSVIFVTNPGKKNGKFKVKFLE